jgi:hypothetical protein
MGKRKSNYALSAQYSCPAAKNVKRNGGGGHAGCNPDGTFGILQRRQASLKRRRWWDCRSGCIQMAVAKMKGVFFGSH